MHEKINYHAVFLLPPQMMILFKPNIGWLSEHAVDPDKRRYMVAGEGAHHFLDIDHYGPYPFREIPRDYAAAVLKFSADTLETYGIVPWWIQVMMGRLAKAFREKRQIQILKYAAELGHYVADAHVPLHVYSNHNGQLTGQQGIHAFWEPEYLNCLLNQTGTFLLERLHIFQTCPLLSESCAGKCCCSRHCLTL
jgi:hypothetical protein